MNKENSKIQTQCLRAFLSAIKQLHFYCLHYAGGKMWLTYDLTNHVPASNQRLSNHRREREACLAPKLHVEKERHLPHTFSFSQNVLAVQIIDTFSRDECFSSQPTAYVTVIYLVLLGFTVPNMYILKALFRCRDMLKGELIVWNAG